MALQRYGLEKEAATKKPTYRSGFCVQVAKRRQGNWGDAESGE
jgi:hypothetical protein